MLAAFRPRRVVDLGCATGLWLDLLDPLLPPDCEFIGFDCDSESLAAAESRSQDWSRRSVFEQCDLDEDYDALPEGDLTLAFNLLPFLHEPSELLASLNRRRNRGALAIRQYDGAALRFGPMDPSLRSLIESSLRASLQSSGEFNHYGMDRVFALLRESPFVVQSIDFELFQRVAPYPLEFIEYYDRSVAWTLEHLSDDANRGLRSWLDQRRSDGDSAGYFFEVDLTSVLS